MKKKKWLIILLILAVVAVCVSFLVIRIKQNKRIPYIAFMYNSTREDCLYICSNGKIYAAVSEESFVMSHEKVIQKIKQNDYGDILEYVGSTNASKVCKMYRLFSKVVFSEDYFVKDIRNFGPALTEYDGKEGHWYGLYSDEKGKLMTAVIYHSNVDKYCTDERAYKIVDWMYDTLKDYMKPDEWTD